jgi:hypothetical protein
MNKNWLLKFKRKSPQTRYPISIFKAVQVEWLRSAFNFLSCGGEQKSLQPVSLKLLWQDLQWQYSWGSSKLLCLEVLPKEWTKFIRHQVYLPSKIQLAVCFW